MFKLIVEICVPIVHAVRQLLRVGLTGVHVVRQLLRSGLILVYVVSC